MKKAKKEGVKSLEKKNLISIVVIIEAIALIAVALTFITIVPPNWFIDMAKTMIGGV